MSEDSAKQMTTTRALIILGGLLFFVTLSLITPARWLGVQTPKKQSKGLDLSYSLQKSDIVIPSSWNELATSNIPQADIQELKTTKPDPKVIENLNDPNNLTASFSKNLYVASTYLAKDPNNNAAMQQQMMDTLINQEAAKIVPTTYSYKDLTIAKNDTKVSEKAYGNAVASLLNGLVTERSVLENFACIKNYTDTKDEKDLALLIKDHEKVASRLLKLKKLSIPASASIYHLNVLNKIAAYKDTLFNISQLAVDPIRATIYIDKLAITTSATTVAYKDLVPYFDIKNIVFNAKDPGYIFTVGYTQ